MPTNNLIEGMDLRTVSTKAQDGPQHPGADALEVVKPLADSTDGDVYIYMTDIHRGFPYEWPGEHPRRRSSTLYEEKIAKQVDQVLTLPEEYQDNIVFVPFNEPEGNMFGTGQWSYNRVSWLDRPGRLLRRLGLRVQLIKAKMPDARIAGPNTSILYDQVKGFLQHALAAGTLPDVITWHELSHPEAVRASVAKYRVWEKELFKGTDREGTQLPDQHQRVRLQLPHLRPRPDDPVDLRDRGVQGRRRHRVLEHRRQPLRLRGAGQPRQRPVVAAATRTPR